MKIRTLAFALLAAAACRGSSSSNTPDAPNGNPDGTVNTDDVDIRDIQDPSDKIADMTTGLNVRGVVVTAIDNYGAKTGTFWVQEPSGTKEYSGILVFKADVSQVATLAIGDLVDITGAEKVKFALSSDTSGRKEVELEPPMGGAITVTKVGTGQVPDPAIVDALTIGQMSTQAAQDAEWRKWTGVLIQVSKVGVISSTKAVGGSMPDPTFQSFNVTGPLNVESSLAAFPTSGTPTPVGPQFGDCEATITGIGDYFFTWNLLPRSTAEVATGGTGCPAAETAAECSDTIDNDANGHADCFDYSCMLDATAQATCIKGVTVHDIDTTAADAPVGGGVKLATACVVAVDSAKQNLWIADAGQAAQDQGIEIFRGSKAAALDATIIPGVNVSVDLAVVLPFHGLMELNGIPGSTTPSPSVTKLNGAPCTVAPLTATLANVADTTMIKHYAGSLVNVSATKLTVTAVTGTGNAKRYTLSDGTTNISMGAAIYDPNATANTSCYSSVTAIATLDTSPNPSVPMLLPTSAAALVPTACQ